MLGDAAGIATHSVLPKLSFFCVLPWKLTGALALLKRKTFHVIFLHLLGRHAGEMASSRSGALLKSVGLRGAPRACAPRVLRSAPGPFPVRSEARRVGKKGVRTCKT